MKYDDLEDTVEPIFAMWKTQRATADEALGDFCHRVGIPAIEKYMESYVLGSGAAMPSPFADPPLPAPDSSVGIDSALLATVADEVTPTLTANPTNPTNPNPAPDPDPDPDPDPNLEPEPKP